MIRNATGYARRQITAVLRRSAKLYRVDAADRYAMLIGLAIGAVLAKSLRLGSSQVSRRIEARTFPLRLARDLATVGDRVRNPRHLILYHVVGSKVVVLGLIHDSMILPRAARGALRRADEP